MENILLLCGNGNVRSWDFPFAGWNKNYLGEFIVTTTKRAEEGI